MVGEYFEGNLIEMTGCYYDYLMTPATLSMHAGVEEVVVAVAAVGRLADRWASQMVIGSEQDYYWLAQLGECIAGQEEEKTNEAEEEEEDKFHGLAAAAVAAEVAMVAADDGFVAGYSEAPRRAEGS